MSREIETAAQRVGWYVTQRSNRRSLDPDEVHGLDTGCDTEATLTLTDLRTLLDENARYRAALERITTISARSHKKAQEIAWEALKESETP